MPDPVASDSVTPPAADQAGGSGAAPEPESGAKSESVAGAVADLLQMAVNYLRQQTAGVMRDKVVLPGQQLGMFVAFALAASFLLAMGIAFLAIALLLVLANFLTWPGALAAIGGVLLFGAAVFTALKVRSAQK
jgi:hypothetical protein